MQHAIELRPEIRKAHELRDVVEHGVSPSGVVSELVEARAVESGPRGAAATKGGVRDLRMRIGMRGTPTGARRQRQYGVASDGGV